MIIVASQTNQTYVFLSGEEKMLSGYLPFSIGTRCIYTHRIALLLFCCVCFSITRVFETGYCVHKKVPKGDFCLNKKCIQNHPQREEWNNMESLSSFQCSLSMNCFYLFKKIYPDCPSRIFE